MLVLTWHFNASSKQQRMLEQGLEHRSVGCGVLIPKLTSPYQKFSPIANFSMAVYHTKRSILSMPS